MQFDNDLGFGRKALPTDVAHNIGVFDTITASQVKNTTIDDPSNTVIANALRTATTSVSLVGATAPAAGQVLTALTPTSAAWMSPSVAVFWDQKASGTNGGTFTSGAWQTRTLNASSGNLPGASLSSNQFTLPPGLYLVTAAAPAHRVDIHQMRLRNITGGVTAMVGQVAHAAEISFANIDTVTIAHLSAFVTLESTKTFELQHRCQTTSLLTDGFGQANGFGVPEVYAVVSVQSIA